MKRTISFQLNGAPFTAEIEPHETALELLRQKAELRSVRPTCGIGICGACTVLVGGRTLSSCLLLAPMLDGEEVTTVEGLGAAEALDPVQQAFLERMGFQCSYCTPGMILTTRALLREHPDPSEAEIKEYLAGNLCRCGSYVKIIESVRLAAERLRSSTQAEDSPEIRAGHVSSQGERP